MQGHYCSRGGFRQQCMISIRWRLLQGANKVPTLYERCKGKKELTTASKASTASKANLLIGPKLCKNPRVGESWGGAAIPYLAAGVLDTTSKTQWPNSKTKVRIEMAILDFQ